SNQVHVFVLVLIPVHHLTLRVYGSYCGRIEPDSSAFDRCPLLKARCTVVEAKGALRGSRQARLLSTKQGYLVAFPTRRRVLRPLVSAVIQCEIRSAYSVSYSYGFPLSVFRRAFRRASCYNSGQGRCRPVR